MRNLLLTISLVRVYCVAKRMTIEFVNPDLITHGSIIFLVVKSTAYIFNSQFLTIIPDLRAN